VNSLAEEFPSITSRPITFVHKVPVLKTRLFWEKLNEGKVYATKCRKCGKVYYPPQGDCAPCLSSDVEWVELSRDAVLETYTHALQRPAGFDQYEPYIIAIVRTNDGVRVMGWLEGIKTEEVRVGMKLEMSTRKLSDGFLVITFKPAGGAEGRT
jgi:uncharacterized OB-fold protein